ncbi:MAG: hydantoinase/oxoprolinase family protein [bacterium]|nr:hydantoinase/oxoprolinase family protein [bacterium]
MDKWRIGIDIGGAFTDLYAIHLKTGESVWSKVESTPPNYEIGVLNGIEELENVNVYVRDAIQIIHGQTVVINTIITRTGSGVGFITTEGFDTIEIQRANRRDIFNFRYSKPKPFVSRSLTRWVKERIDVDGSIYIPLSESEVKEAVRSLLRSDVESIAIGFINSYINPIHETKARELAEEVFREEGKSKNYVTISSDLNREWREYERFNTAILNAYVQPAFVNYIEKLEEILKKKGFRGTFYITLSSGGVVTSEYAKKYPITTIEGGPIAGIMGGVRLASLLNIKNIIVIDGGSTTTKAGIAKDLIPKVHTEYWIEQDEWNAGYPLRVPTLDIHEIGLGGTSIIYLDELGNLRVGPQAAGARPGPACYGIGGNKPTLTDAYVVLGYLNPNYLLGGKLKIDSKKAVEVVSQLAKSLNLDYCKLAHAAIILANDYAANLIRQISIKRGYDPREFTLIAHGGSGPMFAPFIAKELKIPLILVPSIPSGVFNAWGMIGLNIRHEVIQTNILRVEENDRFVEIVNNVFSEIRKSIINMFKSENIDPESVETSGYLDMRYEGQAHTLKVESPSTEITLKDVREIKERFHQVHYNEYGFKLPDSNIEIVSFHLVGVHKVSPPGIERIAQKGTIKNAFLEEREIYVDGREIRTPVYKKELLPPQITLNGPLIIEGDTSTVIVPKDFKILHDVYGNILMKPEA